MKKIAIASLMLGMTSLLAPAQTEFRHISFDEALAASKQENKPVFIDFFTTWCGPCRKMSTQVFPQKEVGDYMNATFIPLNLDAENEAPDLAQKYGIQAYPTYIIVDSEGKELARFTGAMEGAEFIDKLQASMDPERQPARIRERYAAGERDPKLVDAYAMLFMEARDEDNGFKVIDEYYNSLSDADRLKPENSFLFTKYTIDLNNDRAAYMKVNREKFAPENAKDINRHLARLYNSELNKYFSGYMFREGKFDNAVYNQLKNDMIELGLDKRGSTDVIFDMIEKRITMNDAEYLAYCDARYNDLDKRAQDMLVINLSRLISVEDPELCKGMSKFLRARLNTMSPTAIQFAGRTLSTVEGNNR